MGFPDRYDATCRRDGATWSVHVPAIGSRAPARRLAEAERIAAGMIATAVGQPRESIGVSLVLDVPGDLHPLVADAEAARDEADRVSPAAVTRRRALARRLVAEDFAIADVAWLLGVSIARAHQLAGRGPSGGNGRTRGARGRETSRPESRPSGRRPAGTPEDRGPLPARPAPADVAGAHSGYQHEAFLYRGEEQFLAGTAPFVRGGVERGQPVLVAVSEPKLSALRDSLGDVAAAVEFIDMDELGANPARIIPRWQAFVAEHAATGVPLRGIGAPIWAGRRPEELVECQLHEALLNVAVDPDTPLWLSCPYDVSLGQDVIAEAHRSHPTLVEDAVGYRGSRTYGGLHHVEEMFRAPLPDPGARGDHLGFSADGVDTVRALVTRRAHEAGIGGTRVRGLAAVMTEFASNSVANGGGEGVLRIWRQPGALVCEIRDRGYFDDPLIGRQGPDGGDDADHAVWLANEVCDLTQVRSTSEGTTTRVFTWL
jgi:hypothetical protein